MRQVVVSCPANMSHKSELGHHTSSPTLAPMESGLALPTACRGVPKLRDCARLEASGRVSNPQPGVHFETHFWDRTLDSSFSWAIPSGFTAQMRSSSRVLLATR